MRKNIALKLKDASAQKATDAKKKKESEAEHVVFLTTLFL